MCAICDEQARPGSDWACGVCGSAMNRECEACGGSMCDDRECDQGAFCFWCATGLGPGGEVYGGTA